MSFILDALKKLEREKQAKEPDIVVVGPVPWGGTDRRGGRAWLVLSGVALAGILGGAWWLASGSHSDAVTGPSPPVAAAPTPEGSPGTPSSPRPVAGRATPVSPAPRSAELPGDEGRAPAIRTPEHAVAPGQPVRLVDAPLVTEPPQTAQPGAKGPGDGEMVLRLSAISTRDGEPVALLNDRLVREGDAFGDVRILRIGTTEVEIEVRGQRRTVGF